MTSAAGDAFRVRYPFARIEVDVADGDGYATVKSWKPGVEFEETNNGDSYARADGEGAMVLTVVAVFRPGHYPARVFYTRRWVDPAGKEFGKGNLHITTLQAFKRRATAYMHDYEVRTDLPTPGVRHHA